MHLSPPVIGVFAAWLVALVLSLVVVLLTSIYAVNIPTAADAYRRISAPFQRASYLTTVVVLLYLAIHLLSEAFWSAGPPYQAVGIPYLGQMYQAPGPLGLVMPQDIILVGGLVLILALVFLVLPLVPWLERLVAASWTRLLAMFFLVIALLSILTLAWYHGYGVVRGPAAPVEADTGGVALFPPLALVAAVLAYLGQKRSLTTRQRATYFSDLVFSVCLVPSFVIGPLVLQGALSPPDWGDILVVGALFINGFLTLIFIANMSLQVSGTWAALSIVCCAFLYCLALLSFVSWSFLSVFSFPFDTYDQLAPVAFLLAIVSYGIVYERIWRQHFGHWRSEEKPFTMALSFMILSGVALMPPALGWLKVAGALLGIAVLFVLPLGSRIFGIMLVLLTAPFRPGPRQLGGRQFGLPTDWGVVFLKIEPGNLETVKRAIDREEHVHSPMVITGEYDITATVEACDWEDFLQQLARLRRMPGVTSVAPAMNVGPEAE